MQITRAENNKSNLLHDNECKKIRNNDASSLGPRGEDANDDHGGKHLAE